MGKCKAEFSFQFIELVAICKCPKKGKTVQMLSVAKKIHGKQTKELPFDFMRSLSLRYSSYKI